MCEDNDPPMPCGEGSPPDAFGALRKRPPRPIVEEAIEEFKLLIATSGYAESLLEQSNQREFVEAAESLAIARRRNAARIEYLLRLLM